MLADRSGIDALTTAELLLTATAGQEFHDLLPLLADGLRMRQAGKAPTELTVLACESAPSAHKRLQVELQDALGRAGESALQGCSFHQALVEGGVLLADGEDRSDWQGLPVTPVRPFALYLDRQRMVRETGLRLAAYLGSAAGCGSIAEAAVHGKVGVSLAGALREVAVALALWYGVSEEEQLRWVGEWLSGLTEPVGEQPCEPLCRNPMEMLDRNGPFVSAIRMCLKQKRKPVYLSAGLAAVLLHDDPSDPSSQEMRAYIHKKGVGKALDKICKLGPRTQPYWWAREFYKGFQDGALRQ